MPGSSKPSLESPWCECVKLPTVPCATQKNLGATIENAASPTPHGPCRPRCHFGGIASRPLIARALPMDLCGVGCLGWFHILVSELRTPCAPKERTSCTLCRMAIQASLAFPCGPISAAQLHFTHYIPSYSIWACWTSPVVTYRSGSSCMGRMLKMRRIGFGTISRQSLPSGCVA
jgi:hypothetical protein